MVYGLYSMSVMRYDDADAECCLWRYTVEALLHFECYSIFNIEEWIPWVPTYM
jgi:hypothetical protein